MSFIPSFIRHIEYFFDDNGTIVDEDIVTRSHLDAAEFSSAMCGIGLFIVFGTGDHAMDVWRQTFARMRGIFSSSKK